MNECYDGWNIVEVEKMLNEQCPMIKTECFFGGKGELVTTMETGNIWNVTYTPLENLIGMSSKSVVNYLIKKFKKQKGWLL